MLELLTIAYGEKHVERFRRAALKSLSASRNRQSLNNARWNICTDDKFVSHLKREIGENLPDIELNFRSTRELRNYIDPIQSAIITQIESCLRNKSRLLMAPPDTIFGDGSISNLLSHLSPKGSCYVIPHPRVLPSILSEDLIDISNPKLVSLALKHSHRAWSEAEKGHVRQNTRAGGIEWQRITENLYSVTHYLPTVYLIDFTEEDLQYFKFQISFGSFDHTWPGDILIPRERQRYITSSDMCFICEITEEDKNVPPMYDGDPSEFWRGAIHNRVNKGILATWRTE